ncbi:MAG: RNA-binding transcriptional accessory protein [Deltaproteobacteria bacterium]|jgi:uncharacterized protein|nr:RNA-binding transcriptional accessory protein [Deltaproteobacteria bacterium]
MNNLYFEAVSQELSLGLDQVIAVANLLEQGSTVPFIARYRKELTNGLDEVGVVSVRDRLLALAQLGERRQAILKSLTTRELLNPELESKINAALTLTELEDIYLPFRPKKRTRGMVAREKGLEPLASEILAQDSQSDPKKLAQKALFNGAQVETAQEALAGARDILAEDFSETKAIREALRKLFEEQATVCSKVQPGKEDEASKFRDYFDYSELLSDIPSHRYLAIRRGEAEGLLIVKVLPDQDSAISLISSMVVKNPDCPCGQEVLKAATDSYKRLLSLSLETEARLEAKKKADLMAVKIFSENLRELLLAPPLGGKPVLAIDPGYRSGCKAVALSADGELLEYATVFPHAASVFQMKEAGQKIASMVSQHKLEAVAVGNGTAGRETADFVKSLDLDGKVAIILVSESGASVYSASEIARTEFPALDLTVRGAISIGRRLMDPLAELVKIDPKSIGVGQYQHDVDQGLLKRSLDDVVESCVNRVGVEANIASERLLSYVSGLGPQLAKNIIAFRRENGPFKTRRDFLKVPRLGPKAFEQCAGFLRLASGEHPLDRSAVHPESYHVVEKMAADLGVSIPDLLSNRELRAKIELVKYVTDKVGMPTLNDIIGELEKPGRDPRSGFEVFAFNNQVKTLADINPGMRLPAKITNVTAFGAFADVGVHQDGLIHVSQLADKFIKHPSEVVKVGQEVMVNVLDVDISRNRLTLSLKTTSAVKNSSQNSSGDNAQLGSQTGTQTGSQTGSQTRPQARPQNSLDKSKNPRLPNARAQASTKPEPSKPFNSAFESLKKLI